jgi:hypothetical protein
VFDIYINPKFTEKKMKSIYKSFAVAALAIASTISISTESAKAFELDNTPGDGSLQVGVDGFGSFGLSVGGTGTSDAFYDPIGSQSLTETTFDSGVAIRFGDSGSRDFLTSGNIGGSGGLLNPDVTGTATQANSSFDFSSLQFNLTQSLESLFDEGNRTGTELQQTYTITNTSDTSVDFELVRYLDGDLRFDGSLIDGGGRLVNNGLEILFETDSATGNNDPTTFIGITAEGGITPATNRYEIDSFSGLRNRIIAGDNLDNIITGDGPDSDQFIDAGNGFDVTLALRNVFSLDAGETTTYTTNSFFGAGTPTSVVTPTPPTQSVPEPTTILGLVAVCGFGLRSKRKSKSDKA